MIIFLAILGCANAADNETTDLMVADDTIDSAPIANSGAGDFSQLNDTISKAEKPEIKLETYYIFNKTKDNDFKDGINITKDNLVIDGNDHTIDGGNQALIFHVYANNVTLKNIRFINSWGAVEFEKDGIIEGSKFINNSGVGAYGGAVIFKQNGVINGCEFKNNSANYGGAVFFKNKGTVENCIFTDNNATDGGAIYVAGNMNILNSEFNDNKANKSGGAVYVSNTFSDSKINSTFINNSAYNGGAIYFNDKINKVTINGCFKDNDAERAGGAIFVKGQSSNNNFSAEFYDNHALQASGGAIFFNSLAENNVFESIFQTNYALYGGGIFFYKKANSNKFKSDFISNTAKSCGGAMFFYNTTDKNNFTGCYINNSALGEVNPDNGNGGAITFKNVSTNSIFTCDFINNTARLYGGAVNYRETPQHIVFNANFTNNTAKTGGGVNFFVTFEDVIFNGEFIGNTAVNGGALAARYGNINNVSFKNNYAKKEGEEGGNGGAVYFAGSGSTVNCNFTNNRANKGGAVYIGDKGNVVNCIFVENYADYDGGAVYSKFGTVLNSNFTGNAAKNDGGAVYLTQLSNVANCHFDGNSASKDGGALYFLNSHDNVTSCSFVANAAANQGGAVFFMSNQDVNVTICYFEGNSAKNGGAIFTWNPSIFADSCIFKTDSDTINNTIILPPILNAYNFISVFGSGEKLTFNLTTTMSHMPITNGKILISVYVKANDTWVGNYTCLSGQGWTVNLDPGTYYAVFNTEYKDFKPINRTVEIIPDTQFYKNVTSLTTTNRTVNITAKSNIPKNLLLDGKFQFILADGTKINASYASNGTWWAIHEFDHVGEYNVSAAYVGLDNVEVKNATLTINKADSTITLDRTVVNYGDSINVKTEGATAITAKINGVEVSVLDNHVIPLTGFNGGTYNLTVTTIPDEDHYSVTMNVTITVNPLKTQLVGNAITVIYKANKYLVITLKDSNGNPISGAKVTVVLNGAKTYTTDKNGQVKVSTKTLAPKKYSSKVTFNGNANYIKSIKTIKVTVKKATPKLTAKKKTFKKSVKVKKYTITLKYGKTALKKVKVYIKIKGKKYTAKTNSKGKATFKIKKLTKKGTFKSKITFKGNKYYNKVTKKVKIKIK